MWGLQEMLVAEVVDAVRHFEWQSARLTEGVKGVSNNPPDALPRPGHEPKVKAHGAIAVDIDEMDEWLSGSFAELN